MTPSRFPGASEKPEKRGPRPKRPLKRSTKPIARNKRPPRVKAGARAATLRECRRLFSLFVRKREPICAFDACGPTTDCAHHIPVGQSKAVQFDKDNASGLARRCHERLGNSPEWRDWWAAKLGFTRSFDLLQRAAMKTRLDLEAIQADLIMATKTLPKAGWRIGDEFV